MSYYGRPMGDYKTYGYAGDPGFLQDLWGGVKRVGGAVLRQAFPGPAAIYDIARGKPAPPPGALPSPGWPGAGAPSVPTSFPGIGARGPSMLGQGFTFPTASTRGMVPGYPSRGGRVLPVNGCCPTGYHLAKDGSGACVRNRRMNVANPRALRRAMRRVQGFEKLARRTITFTRRTKLKKTRS